MNSKIPQELTKDAIATLFQYDGQNQQIFVQLIQIDVKSKICMCKISDGFYSCKAFISLDEKFNSNEHANCIIKITSHSANQMGIAIHNIKKIASYQKKIGSPIDFKEAKQKNIQNIGSNIIEPQFIGSVPITTNKSSNTNQNIQKTTNKKQIKQTAPKMQQSKPQPLAISGSQDQFNQTIKSLYVGVSKWQIMCRVLKKDYRQFQNKKGKQTKILELQLIDRSSMRITGTFFGEAAEKFKDKINQNDVYQISNGQIRQDNYNNSKTTLFSPYSLMFNSNSVFNPVSDVNLITKSEQMVIDLGEVYQQRIFSKDLDVAAILLEIKDQIELPSKDNSKTLKKRNIIICDPQKQILMYAVLWNNSAEPDFSLVGKSIILTRFKLHQYIDTVSLNSSFKSEIKLLTNHRFNQYEEKLCTSNFQNVSQSKRQHQNNPNNDTIYKSIHQLQQAVYNMDLGDSLKSDLNVWIGRFATGKKWHYDGCTKCSKSLQPLAKCQKCHIIVQKPIPHYAMGVLMADSFGSIWVTAMDDLANKIFNVSISHLSGLKDDQLSDQLQKYLYKEFRLRVTTKKDNQGRIRHNVNKIYDLSIEKIAKSHIEEIKKILEDVK